jgi:hypothetical protein
MTSSFIKNILIFTIFAILNIHIMFHKNIKLIIAGLLVLTGSNLQENNIGNGSSFLLTDSYFLYFKMNLSYLPSWN